MAGIVWCAVAVLGPGCNTADWCRGDRMSQSQPLEFPKELASAADEVRVGEQLRAARIGRGLSLEEVAHDTRISWHYLEALEEERFEFLPAPIYARGFMRSYATYLGLDPVQAVAHVPEQLPRPEGLEPIAGLRSAGRRRSSPISARQAVAVVGIALVAAALLWFAPRLSSEPDVAAVPSQQPAPLRNAVPAFARGTMPDLIGLEESAALAVIDEVDLEADIGEAFSEIVAAGRVIEQAPPPGEPVEPGEVVTVLISRGSQPSP